MTTTEAVEDIVIVLTNMTQAIDTMISKLKELEYRIMYLESQLEKMDSSDSF